MSIGQRSREVKYIMYTLKSSRTLLKFVKAINPVDDNNLEKNI